MANDFPMDIPRGNMNPEAFSNYFCEMLQPMALILGKNTDGNAAEAEDIFFGGSGYSSCVISFNAGTTDGLFDSLLINPDGKQIKISSKAQAGAMASVINLLKSVQDLREAPEGAVCNAREAKHIATPSCDERSEGIDSVTGTRGM